MKALLTGITGNLGYEVSLDLVQRGATLIPCVRPGKGEALSFHPIKFGEVVECDLTEGGEIGFSGSVDCIVHCAGVVRFRDAQDKNEQMMKSVVKLASKLKVPVYYVSTAFVYRPPGENSGFHNSYEKDKFNAERLLKESNIPHSIFRPSVLTGNSRTGKIQNFSGYYSLVRAFLSAVRDSAAKSQALRFPRMTGKSDMVPVDQAAEYIGKTIEGGKLETLYITNPAPPQSEWVLDETLDFYGVRDSLTIVDVSFEEYGKLDLTEEELKLYKFASHFSPYLSMKYNFPQSICEDNLITGEYLSIALSYFRDAGDLAYENRKD